MVRKLWIVEFMIKAPVNKIIPFSNVDGPGNRFAIFFQGCPFQCLFCHNPETIHLCNGCGNCIATCPSKAIYLENGVIHYNKERCIECDTCIKTCPSLSSPKVSLMNVNEILKEMKPVLPYIRGITVSGGEAMMHADFLIPLFQRVKTLGLTCLIDTNGYYSFKNFDELLDICDGVMLDVKAFSSSFHFDITKEKNDIVLENLNYLLDRDKLMEVRTIIYPNFEKENVNTISKVAAIIQNKCTYKLLKYRNYGVRDEGISYFGDLMLSDEQMNEYVELAVNSGAINTRIV